MTPDCSCGRGTYRPERSSYSGRLMAARCSGCNKVTGRCSCEYDAHGEPQSNRDLPPRTSAGRTLLAHGRAMYRSSWAAIDMGSLVRAIEREAALAQPEPLDVERLAEAFFIWAGWSEDGQYAAVKHVEARDAAEAIAAEYRKAVR